MKALAPHWGALLALALFLIVGLIVIDDYGIGPDEAQQRKIGAANARYATGDRDALRVGGGADHLYGVAFEAPLLLVERAFGLPDDRSVYLSRRLLTHLFFLVGGLFAYLLAARLFGARLLALATMLIFLLHPRLYAHSFPGSIDVPFLVLFVLALFLTREAFRRDALGAFVLLGVGVGIAVNLRILGVVLLAAIPAMRALDFALAQGWAERKRVILTTGAFALTAALTAYTLLPYLWADPIGRAVEWWTTLSDHPTTLDKLFRGTIYRSDEFPADYVPVWFSITTPPFALALGLIGAAAVLAGAALAPQVAMRKGRLRFGLLLVGCVAAPVAAVVLLDSNIYNGWRHLYFLWAPFALLAAFGLAALTRALGRPRLRASVYGATGLGLAATLLSAALIHPNQHIYFNALVDRVAPERLRTQYELDYWNLASRQAVEWLSNNTDLLPDQTAPVARNTDSRTQENIAFLPDSARATLAGNLSVALIPIDVRERESWARSARALHLVQVYGNTVLTIERKDDLRAVYESTRGREPDVVAAYDAYQLDGAVALVMEPCAPAFVEQAVATLRVTPVDRGDLPPWREGKREEPRFFRLSEYGAFFDGKCVASLPLPDYPVADFRLVWSAELLARDAARDAMRRAKESGLLLARSAYDIHLADGELVYIQEQCDSLETEHPFRVSVFSERADGSSERQRAWDREIHDFEFHERGALLEEGACVVLFPLPDYPVAGIRTGQRTQDGSNVWSTAFSANPEPYAAAYRAVAGSEPLARGAFDLHLLNGDLVYVKDPCAQADTESRFFLHIVPERVSDLPEARREHGFDNLEFRFFLNGAWFDGRCAARVPLPPYPIASVRTGQFSGDGQIWSAEFALGG